MEGYIFLQRKLFDWEWWSDDKTLRLWLTILLLANYEDRKWHGLEIKRGQLITSLESLSKHSGLSVQSVKTALKHLISTGEITSKSTNKFRVITVEKYDEYQDWRSLNNKQNNNQSNKQLTSKQQSTNKQLTTTNTLNTLNTKNNINNKPWTLEEKAKAYWAAEEEAWRKERGID